jgi:hypothetical protein
MTPTKNPAAGNGGASELVPARGLNSSECRTPTTYNQAPGSLAEQINAAHRRAFDCAQQALEHAAECGRLLLKAKKVIPHSAWLSWLENHTEVGVRQSQKYMQLAKGWAEVQAKNDLSKSHLTVDGALRLLAKPRPAPADKVQVPKPKPATVTAIDAATGAKSATLSVLSSSKSSEWYTPPEIVVLVGRVLGEIDIDPCWHPESPVVATVTIAKDDADGLAHDWQGRVYLNPPYGRGIDDWIAKLVAEYDRGAVTEAIALVPARVDTEWFARLDAFPRCFIKGRLTFANADNPAPFPAAAIYLGKNTKRFAEVFGTVGGIWIRLDEGAPCALEHIIAPHAAPSMPDIPGILDRRAAR